MSIQKKSCEKKFKMVCMKKAFKCEYALLNKKKIWNWKKAMIFFLQKVKSIMFIYEKRSLVDPASSYMLVSKIKPCMSKYTLLHSETAKGSVYQLWFIRSCS